MGNPDAKSCSLFGVMVPGKFRYPTVLQMLTKYGPPTRSELIGHCVKRKYLEPSGLKESFNSRH